MPLRPGSANGLNRSRDRVLRRAAQPTPQDHTEESVDDDICTGKDSNHETRAIGETVIILTSTSKQFRLDSVEAFEAFNERSALCHSKAFMSLITQRLSSVLFLPHVTL